MQSSWQDILLSPGSSSSCHSSTKRSVETQCTSIQWAEELKGLELIDNNDSTVQVIADIARQMGNGMADFIESEVVSVADYDAYCRYVAGLLGIGLSQARISCTLLCQGFELA